MAVVKAIPSIIYDEHSKEVESKLFVVDPGMIAQVIGFGFACTRNKVDEGERTVPQMAKLQQVVLFEETVSNRTKQCVNIIDKKAKIVASDDVMICGECVTLTARNNILLINVPGVYRFVLNDITALGNVQVFLKSYSLGEFPWDSKLFIGERI